jgi:hypothetical protein
MSWDNTYASMAELINETVKEKRPLASAVNV